MPDVSHIARKIGSSEDESFTMCIFFYARFLKSNKPTVTCSFPCRKLSHIISLSPPFEVVDPIEEIADKSVKIEEKPPRGTISQKNNPIVYILTPCYGGLCEVNYTICLTETIQLVPSNVLLLQIDLSNIYFHSLQ